MNNEVFGRVIRTIWWVETELGRALDGTKANNIRSQVLQESRASLEDVDNHEVRRIATSLRLLDESLAHWGIDAFTMSMMKSVRLELQQAVDALRRQDARIQSQRQKQNSRW